MLSSSISNQVTQWHASQPDAMCDECITIAGHATYAFDIATSGLTDSGMLPCALVTAWLHKPILHKSSPWNHDTAVFMQSAEK